MADSGQVAFDRFGVILLMDFCKGLGFSFTHLADSSSEEFDVLKTLRSDLISVVAE